MNTMSQFHPAKIWLDTEGKPINAHGGGVLFHNGKYYWYGEHKIFGKSEAEKADGGIHCYSSEDLYNWKDCGVVLSVDYENEKSEIAYGVILERTKVLYHQKIKCFIAYFKLYEKGKGYETSWLGTAISEKPEGPFIYAGKSLGAGSVYGSGDFYCYCDNDGNFGHLAVRKPDKAFCHTALLPDGKTTSNNVSVLDSIPGHTEAPAGFFYNNKFYLIASGSSGWKPNAARSFSADAPNGIYTDHGNPCRGFSKITGLGAEITFGAQVSNVFQVQGRNNLFIAMFDLWFPEHPIEGKYIWLPVTFENDCPVIVWRDVWDVGMI